MQSAQEQTSKLRFTKLSNGNRKSFCVAIKCPQRFFLPIAMWQIFDKNFGPKPLTLKLRKSAQKCHGECERITGDGETGDRARGR